MKIKPYVEKLEKSAKYKEFVKKYPNAFLAAGFFIIDVETGKNVHQIDFYVPKENKIAAFTLDGAKVDFQIQTAMNKKVPQVLSLDTKIDLDALEGILRDEMRNRGMSEDIKKIIAIIQNIDGKKVWNLNCVLTGMEVLKSHVEDESKTVLKIEKISLMELMKKMPMDMMPAQPAEENTGDQLKKLEKLGEQIEMEKDKLKKQVGKDVETKKSKIGVTR